MTKLLTPLAFWLVIVPVGIVRRWIGIRDLDFRWRADSDTYWLPHQNKQPAKQRYPSQL